MPQRAFPTERFAFDEQSHAYLSGEIHMKRIITGVVLAAIIAAGIASSQTGAQDKGSTPAAPLGGAKLFNAPATGAPGAAPITSPPSIPAPALKAGGAPESKEVTTSSGQSGIKVPHGLVTLIGDVKVPAAETGTMTDIKVKEGDVVDLDQVLAVIDNRDTMAKREMAEGELAVAAAQAESTAELEAAQKGYEVAKAEHEQLVSIRRKNPGAVSDVETRRAQFQVERAGAQIKVAQTDRQVAGLTTGVKRAQLNATDNELERREIKSPLKGEVVEIYKKQGEWVQPGEAVMRIVSLDKLYVEGFVNADQASAGALEGKKANVSVQVFDPKTEKMISHSVKGQINYASPLVEGSGRSRQFRVRAEVENTFADNRWVIQPGSMAEMTIELSAPSPIRATGSTPARSGSTPVSTGRSEDKAAPSDSSKSRTSPSFPRLNAPSEDGANDDASADDTKVESLKPITPKTEDAPKQKPRTSRPF
jgi:multidrug efflux pump subunit AcrA (membrane-fusion protein)